MKENLPIGSIVKIMTHQYDIFTALIIEKNPTFEYDDIIEKYDYRGISYPYGFLGVDTITHIHYKGIIKVIFNPQEENDVANEICISSIIKYKEEEYLIVGKNVKYLGKEKEKEYACVKYNKGNAYEIKYIKESEIDEIIRYGYTDNRYKDIYKNKYEKTNEALIKFRALLPMGSIVTLEGPKGEVDVLIVDRYKEENEELSDYLGVFIESSYKGAVVTFDKQQIEEIKYLGYWDKEEANDNLRILLEKGLIEK